MRARHNPIIGLYDVLAMHARVVEYYAVCLSRVQRIVAYHIQVLVSREE